MYQTQQSFHSSGYQGNQQGHDSNLRGDSSRPAQSFGVGASAASGFGQSVASQYQPARSFQPTGFVQSSYGQNQGASNQSFGTTSSFHSASYRGNQQGHDSYLRADATRPSNIGFGGAASGFQNQNQFAAQFTNNFQNQQYQSPQSFHAASYRGNQQGHDSNLRADATRPSNIGFGGAGSFQSQAGLTNQTGFQSSIQSNAQMQQAQQFQSPQSFHAASYRGNQAGHDQYLRADSAQTSQSFGR